MAAMFDYLSSSVFFYSLEMLLAMVIFGLAFEKRKYFIIRTVSYFFVYEACIFLFDLFLKPLFGGARSTVWFAMLLSLLFIAICFHVKGKDWLFGILAALLLQHIMFLIQNILFYLIPAINQHRWTNYLVKILIDAVVVFFGWLCFARRVKKEDNIRVTNIHLVIIATCMFLLSYILRIFVPQSSDSTLICNFFDFACTVAALLLQFSEFDKSNVKWEKQQIEELLRNEQIRYEQSMTNMDIINLKFHDLKYQLKALQDVDGQHEREILLKQTEDELALYDSFSKSGNTALDQTLTEKSFYCRNHSIRFTCIADGKSLSRMAPIDIYTMFGNALDNAIECVMQYQELEKRIIELKVFQKKDMTKICIENYCEQEVKCKGGMPITTKGNEAYHGFGTKSIQYLAEKYEGFARFDWKDKIFSLNIVLPHEKN